MVIIEWEWDNYPNKLSTKCSAYLGSYSATITRWKLAKRSLSLWETANLISLEPSTLCSALIASSILLHHFINFDVINIDNEYSGITKIANRIPKSKVLCIYIQIPKLLYCFKKFAWLYWNWVFQNIKWVLFLVIMEGYRW